METFTNSVLNLKNIDKHQRKLKALPHPDVIKIKYVQSEEISDKINF